MNKEKIEEIEKFERLVRKFVAPFYIADSLGYGRDYQYEKSIDDKVLYYLKLGLTCEDMEDKIKRRDEKWEQRHGN